MTVFDLAMPPSLVAWRRDSRITASPHAMAAARAAVMAALPAHAPTTSPRPRHHWVGLPFGLLRWRFAHARLVLTGAVLAASVAVVAAGWNSAPGTPLHAIQVAVERLQLAFPQADQTALRLQFAEARLADAQQGRGNRTDDLREAGQLLDDVRPALPAAVNAPLRVRWEHDESELTWLQSAPPGAPGAPSQGSGSSGNGEGSGAASPGAGSPSGAPSESEEPRGSPAPSSTAAYPTNSPADDGSPRPSSLGGGSPSPTPPGDGRPW